MTAELAEAWFERLGGRVGAVHATVPAMLLFVYGTLCRGEVNHAQLAGSRFVAEARTPPEYELVDLGSYPALIEAGQTAVHGELYDVPERDFPRLDEFEDVPVLYARKTLLIDAQPAFVYVMPRALAGARPRIAGGDWRKSRRPAPL